MNLSSFAPRCLAALLVLGAGTAMAATQATTSTATTTAAAGTDKAAPVQLAQAATTAATTTQGASAAPKRNAQGQLESTKTRDWSTVDRNRDGLVGPDEMQAYLEGYWR